MGVFGLAQGGDIAGGAEVFGVVGAAVGRVKHQGRGAGHGADHGGLPRRAGGAGLGLLEGWVNQWEGCMHRQGCVGGGGWPGRPDRHWGMNCVAQYAGLWPGG
jgi:hypothetical protein